MDYVGIGKRIRAQRYKLDLSQEELAEMAGISLVHMSHIETANTKLSLPVLVDLAKDELLEEITLELDGCSKEQLLTLRQILSSSKEAIQKYLER